MTSPTQDRTSLRRRSTARRDLLIALVACSTAFILAATFGLLERVAEMLHVSPDVGNLVGFLLALSAGLGVFSFRRWRELQCSEQLRIDDLRRLSNSESRYRTLVESPSLGVILMDVDGRIRYASPKIEELTGYTPREFSERPECRGGLPTGTIIRSA